MKKTTLFLLSISLCLGTMSQTDAVYCNFGDENDFLLVMLSFFSDGNYQLDITDMTMDDQPVDLHISTGCYIEDKNGIYVLTDSYGNKLTVTKEGTISAVCFDKTAPVYLQNKRLFFLGKTDSTTKRYASYTTWSYFSKKELREYLSKNKTKYSLSDGIYRSVRDIDFSLTLQNKEYILHAESFHHNIQTLSRGKVRRYKNIFVLKDEGGFVFYMLVSKDGILLKYNNGYELLNLVQ